MKAEDLKIGMKVYCTDDTSKYYGRLGVVEKVDMSYRVDAATVFFQTFGDECEQACLGTEDIGLNPPPALPERTDPTVVPVHAEAPVEQDAVRRAYRVVEDAYFALRDGLVVLGEVLGGAAELELNLAKEASRLRGERDAWERTAAEFARNADFARGLLVQIGEMFGVKAMTSDDGSVQDRVLLLKVPELVREQAENLKSAYLNIERMAKAIAAEEHRPADIKPPLSAAWRTYSAQTYLRFVEIVFATSKPYRCGACAEILFRMLSLSGYSASLRCGEVNGVPHVWVVCDGVVLDPTRGQFDTTPEYPTGTEAPMWSNDLVLHTAALADASHSLAELLARFDALWPLRGIAENGDASRSKNQTE